MKTDNKDKVLEIAKKLNSAAQNKTAIPPIREDFDNVDVDMAYKVQQVNTQSRIAQGAVPVGKKIGLTSKTVQRQLGVDEPDFGTLFNDMKVENGHILPWSQTMQPKVETEIAFVLKNDIDKEDPTLLDIENAIDHATVSIEVVGSRIKDWDITILDTVADNASASHFVLGAAKVALADIDLTNCGMQMYVNGALVATGQGKASMGSPLIAVQWLAQKMISLKDPLKKGDVVLSGSLSAMAAIRPGDVVLSKIEGLGEVSVQFSKE